MKIGVVGGGPAGLYFALLMKKLDPAHEIRLLEQNPAHATYGWGVVFSDRALSFLGNSDPESHLDIKSDLEVWDKLVIVHKDEPVAIDGSLFSGISRIRLLRILHEHCRRRGVDLQFETRLDDLDVFADCDLIVGADGVSSFVRQKYGDFFQPSVVRNRRWYHDNVVLIGDALRTVHFSIGSGTRTAFEDAMALSGALERDGGDVQAALQRFENIRKPSADQLLEVAQKSLAWYEDMRHIMILLKNPSFTLRPTQGERRGG